jgi:hypothetical protein
MMMYTTVPSASGNCKVRQCTLGLPLFNRLCRGHPNFIRSFVRFFSAKIHASADGHDHCRRERLQNRRVWLRNQGRSILCTICTVVRLSHRSGACCVVLAQSSVKSFTVAADSQSEKEEWMQILRQTIEQLSEKKASSGLLLKPQS